MSTSSPAALSEQAEVQYQALLDGPAGPPPPGAMPNFSNSPNLNAFVFLTVGLCMCMSTVSVVLRIYTKRFIMRSLAYEDSIILIAWIGQIGYVVPSTFTVRYGAGTHMWDVRLKTFFSMLYWVNVTAIIYGFVVFFVKLSILLQYLRIFAPTRKGNMFMFMGAYMLIGVILTFYFVDSMFEICKCTPRKKIWNPLMRGGHCFSPYGTFQATGIFNVISDFLIFLLPMPSVWKLQLPRKKKMLMIIIFGAGLFACISSILRTYYTWKLVHSADMTYYLVPMGMWGDAELSTGIIISCLPIMPKFFQHVAPKAWKALSFRSTLKKSSVNGSADERRPSEAMQRKRHMPIDSLLQTESLRAGEVGGRFSVYHEEYVRLEDGIATTPDTQVEKFSPMPKAKLATTRSYTIY